MPTRRSETVFLDLGANAECDADNLVQFAVMGEVYARAVLGVTKPTVGLLNIGTEEVKGHDTIREAAAALRASHLPIEFRGFVEGTDLTSGKVDVVVTDGFTGNVALKVMEGTVGLYTQFLREAFKSSMLAQVGYALAKPALQLLRQRLDPRRYNGAMFLGLNGIVVKSHGGTDALGFANAIGVAVDLAAARNQRTNHGRTEPAGGGGDSATARPGVLNAAGADHRYRGIPAGQGRQQRRAGDDRRHQRRLDRRAHRHPAAPHRRRGRAHVRSGVGCGARGAGAGRDRPGADRPAGGRHLDPGQHVSRLRDRGATQARRGCGLRPSTFRRCAAVSSTRSRSPATS